MRLPIARAVVGAACVLSLVACHSDTITGTPRSLRNIAGAASVRLGPRLQTLDEMFLVIDSISPGFGGMYWSDDSVLTVVHRRSDALDEAKRAIARVMGSDIPGLHGRSVRLRSAKFGFGELSAFRRQLEEALHMPALVMFDVDEVNNRVLIGIDSDGARGQIVAQAEKLGIPTAALVVETMDRPRPASTFLQDRASTVVGGLMLTNYASTLQCSMSFNISYWDSVDYMVTAGHCTPTMGSVDTSYYMSQPYFAIREAQEYQDPSYTSANCPSGYTCRYSDAAVFRWMTSQTIGQGLLAHPDSESTTWAVGGEYYSSTYSITGEAPDSWLLAGSGFFAGTLVHKVGFYSGLTTGNIKHSCFDEYLANAEVLHCQFGASYYSHPGDSGAAVFMGAGPVQLAGLSNYVSTSESFFSSITGIQIDFGQMQTYPSKPHP